MHWSTIVIQGMRRGVTAKHVADATGYPPGCVDLHSDGSAWIEVANDGRTEERRDRATEQLLDAELLEV